MKTENIISKTKTKNENTKPKLMAQGSFGCVYYPGLKCKSKLNKKYISKLQKNDFNSINEVINGKIIKKIKNYNQYFGPIVDMCYINLSTIDNPLLEKCELIKYTNSNDFIILYTPYIENISFAKFLLNQTSEEIILSISSSLIHLLKGIQLLFNNNIVHMDLKDENILYNVKTKTPIIIDFGISLQIDNLYTRMREFFYVFGPDYFIWCIEIHCISYLLHVSPSFTQKSIDKICKEYVENNSALFHEKIKKNIYDKCQIYLKKFIGLPKDKIIQMCIESINTWDLYSISILYIRLLTFVFKNLLLNNKWLLELYTILFDNINPDPKERHTIEKTIKLIEELNEKDHDLTDILNVI